MTDAWVANGVTIPYERMEELLKIQQERDALARRVAELEEILERTWSITVLLKDSKVRVCTWANGFTCDHPATQGNMFTDILSVFSTFRDLGLWPVKGGE